MKVKRYVADTMGEALKKIKAELGNTAVIVNSKNIKEGGFLGFFAKAKVEVIAAVDEQSAKPVPAASKPFIPYKHQAELAEQPTQRTGTSFKEVLGQHVPVVLPTPVMESTLVDAVPRIVKEDKPGNEQNDTLIKEMKQMKEMMSIIAKGQMGNNSVNVLDPRIEKWQQMLLDQEVESSIVEKIVTSVEESLKNSPEHTEDTTKEMFRKALIDILQNKSHKSLLPTTKIAHFIGPTGVGKTTTIAKLAAIQSLTHGKKIGFITADTYRMAAVDQLRTYATILGAPLEVVFSPHDLARAFQALSDRDMIFMDTAGRNFKNPMYVSEVNSLIQNTGNCETFLVLSLTAKYKDMKQITANFSKFNINKVLFTKMDETSSYGAVVNIVNDFGLSLSYVANGQNVPDDIREMDENRIVNSLLGDTQHD